MGVDKTHFSYTTHTVGLLIWLGLFRVQRCPPPPPYNFCWISKRILSHLHDARCGTVAAQCFLFIISVTKFAFSLWLALPLNYGWIKATKTIFQIATSHHITQNFRSVDVVWRWVSMMLILMRMRYLDTDGKMDRIVLSIQSNRFESSPQPFSVTNFVDFEMKLKRADMNRVAKMHQKCRTVLSISDTRGKSYHFWWYLFFVVHTHVRKYICTQY